MQNLQVCNSNVFITLSSLLFPFTRLVAHEKCKNKFPNNCGFNEKQFGDVIQNLGINPQLLKTQTSVLPTVDENEASRPSDVPEVTLDPVSRRSTDQSSGFVSSNTSESESDSPRDSRDFEHQDHEALNKKLSSEVVKVIRKSIKRSALYQRHILASKLEDFEFITMIGNGSFGKVIIIENIFVNDALLFLQGLLGQVPG